MMRTLTGLLVVLALGLASAATAATISVDTDKKTYLVGETITVTTTATVTGSEGAVFSYLLELLWDDARIAGVPGPAAFGSPLTSFGGLPWLQGSGLCLAASCLVFDELSPTTGLPQSADATGGSPRVGTLTMLADTEGLINFAFGITLTFGTTTFGSNAATAEIVPEPGTAALLGLGLTGLALAGRRRR